MSIRNIIFRTKTGLKPEELDYRDIPVGLIWNLIPGYKPKSKKLVLETREAKNQYKNTCGWASSVGMKEIDEKEELSVRGNVIFGKIRGYISGDGFSTLRNNQKVLQKDGAIPAHLLDDNKRISWTDYSNSKHLTPEMKSAAVDRRIKSYLKVYLVSEVYRCLDNGRPVQIGIDWYTGWNLSGGFKLPWLVYKTIGYFVGGHALYICGYDQEYKGQKVFIIRNSFGKKYGDNGNLYLTEKMLEANIGKYGAFINYDLDKNILQWLQEHQGNIVKGSGNDVWLIQGDKKRLYPDEATLISNGKTDKDIIVIDDKILNEIKQGDDISFWQGDNVKQIKEMILKRKDLKELFAKYFKELF